MNFYFIPAQIVKMMDEEDGVVNRKKRKVGVGGGVKPRKYGVGGDTRALLSPALPEHDHLHQLPDEDSNYLTVTSVDLRNWFRGITGARGQQA